MCLHYNNIQYPAHEKCTRFYIIMAAYYSMVIMVVYQSKLIKINETSRTSFNNKNISNYLIQLVKCPDQTQPKSTDVE